MDFEPSLNSSETITIYTVNAYDPTATIPDVTSTMIGSIVITGQVFSAYVLGGADGKRYKLTFKIQTDRGTKRKKDVFMRVTDI